MLQLGATGVDEEEEGGEGGEEEEEDDEEEEEEEEKKLGPLLDHFRIQNSFYNRII
jgi:hypothetical protein